MYNIYRDVQKKQLIAIPDTEPMTDMPGFVYEKKVDQVFIPSDTTIQVHEIGESLPKVIESREQRKIALLTELEKNYKELTTMLFSAEGRIINIDTVTKDILKEYPEDTATCFRVNQIANILNDKKLYNQRTQIIRTITQYSKDKIKAEEKHETAESPSRYAD